MSGEDATDTLRRHGRSFALAARLLPRREADRAARLYAVCREIDDLVDRDGSDAARARLRRLRDGAWHRRGRDPLARALARLAAEGALERRPVEQLIDGVLADAAGRTVPDERALIRYAYRVGGTVGLLMCAAFGIEDPAARRHAVDLGIALQLVNIARDVGEDARLGRRYLPGTWLAAAPAEIAAAEPATRRDAARAVLRLLALAERYHESGRAGLAHLPDRLRPGIAAAAAVYRAIGTRLARRGGDALAGRVVVPRWRKLLIAGRAATGPAPRPRPHDRALHDPIFDLVARAGPGEAVDAAA